MKALKLLVILLLLSGGIFLILNWSSVFPSPAPTIEKNWSEVDKLDITAECKKIKDAWAQEEGWNEELYRQQRADIDQSQAMGLFSIKGYDTVDRCLHETATNKACDGYIAALHAPSFSDADLQKQYKGVLTLKKKEQLGNDPRSRKVEQIHQLYTSIRKFINTPHKIKGHYNAHNNSWEAFDVKQKAILGEARKLRQNPLFSEVSMVPGFKTGLDESALGKKLTSSRKSYYQQIGNEIINHFKNCSATMDNYNLMDDAIYRFHAQAKDKALLDKLTMAQYQLGQRIKNSNPDEI